MVLAISASHTQNTNTENPMNKTILMTSSLLAATLSSSPVLAQSRPALNTQQVVVSLGQFIAAQGNDALRQMRDELKKDLVNALKPVLPAQPASAADARDTQ